MRISMKEIWRSFGGTPKKNCAATWCFLIYFLFTTIRKVNESWEKTLNELNMSPPPT